MMKELSYLDLLNEVAGWRRERKQQMQLPATPEDLESLRLRGRAQLGVEIPEEYVEFLRVHDGLSWNGLLIYASHTTPIAGNPRYSIQGFVESNLAWRGYDAHRDYLFFGESDMEIYCLRLATREHQVTDRQSGRLIRTAPSFEHLISDALRAHRLNPT